MNQTDKLFARWVEDMQDIQAILPTKVELTLDHIHDALRQRKDESPEEREKQCFQTFRCLEYSKRYWDSFVNMGFIVEENGQTKVKQMFWITLRLFFVGEANKFKEPDFDLVCDALIKHNC